MSEKVLWATLYIMAGLGGLCFIKFIEELCELILTIGEVYL